MIFFNLLVELFFINKKLNRKIRYDFFNQHSFSLPNSAKYDRLIGFRQLFRNLRKLWLERIILPDQQNDIKSVNFLYVLSPVNISKKLEYLKNIDQIKAGISRANLFLELNFLRKIQISLLLFIFYSFVVFYVFLFRKNRINIALFPEIILQCYLLVKKLKILKCQKLYFFYTHEPESNFISHILISRDISIIKIPNTNPLFMFNKNMIASKVILTLGYQSEEVEIFSDYRNISIENWPPFALNKYYNHDFKTIINHKICYYSHGSWLRTREDHHLPKFDEVSVELNFLEKIKGIDFLTHLEITVCLHPKEKINSNIFNQAKNYYYNIFGRNISFFKGESYESFNKFDVGFGSFSSILFERLHCGYKTILYTKGINDFPISNSKFERFITKDINDCENEIKNAVNTDCESFFNNHLDYTYKYKR